MNDECSGCGQPARAEGVRCEDCGQVVTRIAVTDSRAESEKAARPLNEIERTMLWCGCNHPGDAIIGGMF